MKSFAKVGLLFALIVAGRYLQPAASATLAVRAVPAATQALPLVLVRYTTPPALSSSSLSDVPQPVKPSFL